VLTALDPYGLGDHVARRPLPVLLPVAVHLIPELGNGDDQRAEGDRVEVLARRLRWPAIR
jgi:hypothetical protein